MELESIFKELSSQFNRDLLYNVTQEERGLKVEIFEKIKKNDKNPPTLTHLTLFGFDYVIPLDQDRITPYRPNILYLKKEMNRSCDGILIASIQENPCFIIVEMKSSLSNRAQHIEKMRAGKILVSYLKDIILEYLNINITEWNTYYCIFHIADPKRETIFGDAPSQDPQKPVYFCVENYDRFSALKLINRPLL